MPYFRHTTTGDCFPPSKPDPVLLVLSFAPHAVVRNKPLFFPGTLARHILCTFPETLPQNPLLTQDSQYLRRPRHAAQTPNLKDLRKPFHTKTPETLPQHPRRSSSHPGPTSRIGLKNLFLPCFYHGEDHLNCF